MVLNTPLAPKLNLSDDQAWHYARRLCMGPTWEIADEIRKMGTTAWIDKQLNPNSIDDRAYQDERNRYMPYYNMVDKDFYVPTTRPFATENFGRYANLAKGGLIHEYYSSKKYLQSMMCSFWHDHFSINFGKTQSSPIRHINAIRSNSLGKFSDLLISVYSQKAMNEYLDNHVNIKTRPNQNLARELMELHTVGVNGGYTQDDIFAVSRLLSGKKLNHNDGSTYFDPAQHDNQPVKALGWSSPNNATTSDGITATVNSYLTYLANRPATAAFLAKKLVAKFVQDEGNAALEKRLASIYLSSGTNMTPVLKALFTSNEFKNSIGTKYRRPQQQLTAIYALVDLKFDKTPIYPDTNYLNSGLSRLSTASHHPFAWSFPDGFPYKNDYWLAMSSYDGALILTSTIYDIKNRAAYPNNYVDLPKRFNLKNTDTYGGVISRIVTQMTGHTPDATTIQGIADYWAYKKNVPLTTPIDMNRIDYGIQAVTVTPYFQII